MRKRLSSGEWGVMNALWRAGKRASVDDVRSELEIDPERDYRTIQTILYRCSEKGWVRIERDGGRCYYTAAVTRRKGVEERAAAFFSELAEGETAALEAVQGILERELRLLKRKDGGNSEGARKGRPRR